MKATAHSFSDHLIFRLDTRHRANFMYAITLCLLSAVFLGTGSTHCTKAWNSVDIRTQADNLVSDQNETVFIVVEEYIYKYNSSDLTLKLSTYNTSSATVGSAERQLQLIDSSGTSRYDSTNKALFLFKRNKLDLLTSCWQTKNSSTILCHVYRVDDLKVAPLLLTNKQNQAFKTESSETIRILLDSKDSSSLILTTSKSTYNPPSNLIDFSTDSSTATPVRLPAIGRFYMLKTKSSFALEQKSVLPYRAQLGDINLFYDYIHMFEYNDHTHFILNDLRRPKNVSNPGDSLSNSVKLARICNNDTDLTSYTEISLMCNNLKDLYAKVAHLDTTKVEPILYVIFEAKRRTHLCTYSLNLIDDVFSKAISDCNNGLPTSILLTKLHPETVNHAMICNKNPATDWCLSKTNPYIDGFSDQYRVFADNYFGIDDLLSVNFFHTTQQGEGMKDVYFIGTETGFLTKIGPEEDLIYTIDLNDEKVKPYRIGDDKKISSTVAANETTSHQKPTKYALNKRRIIAANRGKLHSIDIDSCHHYTSCRACTTVRDPLDCVWCTGVGCTKKSECSAGNQSTMSCPPIIKDFSPKSGPLTGSTKLKIEGENFGSDKGILMVKLNDQDCLVNRKESTSETIYCLTKPVDHPQNVSLSVDVTDESSYSSTKGNTTSKAHFSYVRIKLFGIDPDSPYSEQEIKLYGENLDAGFKRNITVGGLKCKDFSHDQNTITCSIERPTNNVSELLLSKPQQIEVLIDGHKQIVESNDKLSMLFHFKQVYRTQDGETDNTTYQQETTSDPMNIVFIFVLLIVLSILLMLCLTKLDKLPKFKMPPSFKITTDDTGADVDTKVSFRNPSSHKFINSNPGVNASESLHGLVKLNGSVMSSDYFGKPEHLEQDKPLIHNSIDDEMLSLLSQEKILIDRNRLTLGHVLGSGQFGRVYKGFLKIEDTSEHVAVAVKTLHSRCAWDDSLDSKAFLDEGLMMRDFDHENVLALIGVTFDSSGSPMVITPFMLYGDLKSYISDEASSPTVKELIEFGIQVAKGMAYLSNLKFVHRDLAARNCMLDEELIVKVADFGLSRDIYERDYYSSDNKKVKLPVKWMAIESLEKSIYSTKTDVWSYGVLLWELMTRGVVPYPDVDNFDLFSYLKEGRRMLRPRYCPVILYNIMLSCWAENPMNRPTFDELVVRVSEIITQLREAKDDDGQQKVSRDETYCDVLR